MKRDDLHRLLRVAEIAFDRDRAALGAEKQRRAALKAEGDALKRDEARESAALATHPELGARFEIYRAFLEGRRQDLKARDAVIAETESQWRDAAALSFRRAQAVRYLSVEADAAHRKRTEKREEADMSGLAMLRFMEERRARDT